MRAAWPRRATSASRPPPAADAHARCRFLLSQLSPEQQQRYEFFRRSGFQRSTIKRVMQNVANTPISQTMAIVMAGISKVYVGELVETGAPASLQVPVWIVRDLRLLIPTLRFSIQAFLRSAPR